MTALLLKATSVSTYQDEHDFEREEVAIEATVEGDVVTFKEVGNKTERVEFQADDILALAAVIMSRRGNNQPPQAPAQVPVFVPYLAPTPQPATPAQPNWSRYEIWCGDTTVAN